MCFSGRCSFENYGGGCNVKDHKVFFNILGESACYVGSIPDCAEAEIRINENKEYFKNLKNLAYKKQLVW